MTSLVVALLCTNLNLENPNQFEACSKGMTATAVQIGADAQFRNLERFADRQARQYLNDTAMFAIGTSYTIYQTRRLIYSMPVRPYVDSVSVEAGADLARVKFDWNF